MAACANGGPVGIAGDLGGPGAAEKDDGGGQAGEDAASGGDSGGRITGEDASQPSGNDAGGNGGDHDGGAGNDAGHQQPPPQDAGNGNSTCAGPNTPANCHACSGQSCQPNGCYNGYLCDTVTDKCKAPNSCP